MAVPKYEDYLAAQLLSEGKIVSYRTLSRALKVHCNVAKEMLYEFHRIQNSRKPGAIHATYLLVGQRKPDTTKPANGVSQDTDMANTSFLSSSMPEQEQQKILVPVTSIILVCEEELEGAKQLYEEITSIHVYSLEPGPLNNIQILSDCNRRIAAEHSTEDPLEAWKQYGTIHNSLAKRRTGARPPPPAPVAPALTTTTVKAVPKPPVLDKLEPANAQAATRRDSGSSAKSEDIPSKRPTGKAPTLKRDSSSIFKSFAKTKPVPKKDAAASPVGSGAPSPAASGQGDSQVEDEVMKDAPLSDEEFDMKDGDFVVYGNDAETAEKSAAFRKAKQEREDALRKMMDDDEDEPMEDPPALEEGTSLHSPPLEPTPDGQSVQPQQIPSPEGDADEEPATTTSNGRRRGRRKVMRKKTTRDADGYLVTKEEPAWESFSEDEVQPPVKKAKPATPAVRSAPAASTGEKGDKASGTAKKGKVGQGNIMNFFAKK